MLVDGLEPAPILDAIEREARRVHAPVQLVSATRLDREARTEGHQGVMAIADPMPTVALEELLENPRALLLVADSVSDPRNLGAILRSADGAGVTGVVLPSHRSARLTPAVTKTAAGAIEYLSFAEVPGIPSAVERLRKSGVRVLGLDGESRTSIYDLNLHDGPVAVVVGGEAKGLSALTRKRCDDLVALPQRGAMKSLNAAVAASVALYEVSRQRR
jgi:23S rRNA (guanosine2251-2'-O)-methyltransferase